MPFAAGLPARPQLLEKPDVVPVVLIQLVVLGIIALVLITAGLGFKIAAVPFHFYAPDVYEGTTAFNAGLLAVVPKAAGFVALIRVVSQTMAGFETTGQQLMLILAAITMTGGNCLALLQTNVRRLLASLEDQRYVTAALARLRDRNLQ